MCGRHQQVKQQQYLAMTQSTQVVSSQPVTLASAVNKLLQLHVCHLV